MRLLDRIDLRAETPCIQVLECRSQRRHVDDAVRDVELDQAREQVRRLDQGVLGRRAIARVDVLRDAVGQEPERQHEHAEQAEKGTVAGGHDGRRSSASA